MKNCTTCENELEINTTFEPYGENNFSNPKMRIFCSKCESVTVIPLRVITEEDRELFFTDPFRLKPDDRSSSDIQVLVEKLIKEMDRETVIEKLKEIERIENRFSNEVIEFLKKRHEELEGANV